ncbi:MAG: DNA repair protein RecO [Acidimicrobiia bacterium]
MPGLFRDQGVVLRTVKLGEADRIVTFITQGHGKVRAVAKGVRKSGSKFGGRLEPTSHLAFQAYQGRGDLDTVTQVEVIDPLRKVREDYTRLTHALPMLEAVDQVAQDREPHPALYRMLVGALRELERNPSPMITTAFVLKLCALEGFQPSLDECVQCASPGPFPAFDPVGGGVLCGTCAQYGGVQLTGAALDVLHDIFEGGLNRALAAPVGPTTREVERIAVSVLEHHVERRLRSAALL